MFVSPTSHSVEHSALSPTLVSHLVELSASKHNKRQLNTTKAGRWSVRPNCRKKGQNYINKNNLRQAKFSQTEERKQTIDQ